MDRPAFRRTALRASVSTSRVDSDSDLELQPLGAYAIADEPIRLEVGRTGVVVSVSDLNMLRDEREVWAGGRMFKLPGLVKMGAATVEGTEGTDRISIYQDGSGDMFVEVFRNGATSRLNLGRIAGLTIRGNGGNDVISVSVRNIFGGLDIDAGAGDDSVTASVTRAFSRGVTIRGGAGADLIALSGESLAALLDGGSGRNNMSGVDIRQEPAFALSFIGGPDADTIRGSAGRDLISGGAGADVISAGAGGDTVIGGAGRDELHGQVGNDLLCGEVGDDRLHGGHGNDVLVGGPGADLIEADAGDDYLWGGDGADALYAGPDRDVMWGGDGADNFGPLVRTLDDVFAYGILGAYLKVIARGAHRAQHKIGSTSGYELQGKALADYDADADYLVDVNELA